MSKDKLIPELRFPDFNSEEQWDSKPLDDLCELITKGTTPTTLGFSYTESGANFIKIESILEGNINLEKAAFISIECNEALKRSQLREDDILFSIAGALGVVTTVTKEILPANTNQALSIVRLKNKKQKDYVKAFLTSNLITSEVQKIKAGAAQPNISLNQVANFRILIPKNKNEHQKIALCLSSLDEVIAAHSQKLELLKDHKKGLMQNLFPQEGETVPKYRFKEFEKDGEWVEKKLGELGEFLGGGTPSRTNSEYWTGNIPWISSSDIHEDDIHSISISQYINEIAIVESATKIIPKGSVLFVSRVGVGKLAINNEELCTSQDFTSFIPTEVLNLFVAYYYSANKNALQSLSQGTSIKGFSISDLKDSKIVYPKNSKEQQKIASCLSTLDALFTAQAEKIAQLQLHKKGLMQGLFPKIND